jgi:hypothetical protein
LLTVALSAGELHEVVGARGDVRIDRRSGRRRGRRRGLCVALRPGTDVRGDADKAAHADQQSRGERDG